MSNPSTVRGQGERGNAILESALVFLPMMALLFGLLDISLAIYIQSTFSNATRSGSRLAVTYPSTFGATDCSSSQLTCIVKAVQDNSAGFLSGSKSQYIVVKYYTTNDLGTPLMTCQSGVCTLNGSLPQTLTSGQVVTNANDPGNVVEVTVSNYPLLWMAPMPKFYAGAGLTLNATSTDVLGGLPLGSYAPPAP